MDLGVAGFGNDLAQGPQVVDIAGMDRELVVRRGRLGVVRLGMCPAGVSSRAGVDDRVWVRATEVGSKGDVEGQVDKMAGDLGVWLHLMLGGHVPLDVCGRHGHVLVVRTAKTHSRRHLVPTMACLAGKVGDLVHRRSRMRRGTSVWVCVRWTSRLEQHSCKH